MKLTIAKVYYSQKYYDNLNVWSCYPYDAPVSEKREVCSYSGILIDGKKDAFERKFKHIPKEKIRFEYTELIPEMIKCEWIGLLYEMKKNQTVSIYKSFVEMPSSLLKMYEQIGKEKNLLTIGEKKMSVKEIQFDIGDNIFILFGKMKKVLENHQYEEFKKRIDDLGDNDLYDKVIELAEEYVDIV